MLAFFLFIALTNLVLGIILGYFYGDDLVPKRLANALAAATPHAHEPATHVAATVAAAPPAAAPPAEPVRPAAVAEAPAPTAAATPPAEDLRPVKPTGSREISALDLADVMGELGIAPPTPEATAPAPSTEEKPAAPAPAAPSPAAAAITFEALTGEPEPIAG